MINRGWNPRVRKLYKIPTPKRVEPGNTETSVRGNLRCYLSSSRTGFYFLLGVCLFSLALMIRFAPGYSTKKIPLQLTLNCFISIAH